MYEAIKHFINTLISKIKVPPHKAVLDAEYELLLQKVKDAKTFGLLLKVRKDIEDYRKEVAEIGSPVWARNHLAFLMANWERQYRLWKLRG